MIHINKKWGILGKLFPESYTATTIDDFLNEQDSIKPTNSLLWRKFKGGAFVSFPETKFRFPTKDEIAKINLVMYTFNSNSEKIPVLFEELYDTSSLPEREMMRKSACFGFIYDSHKSLMVNTLNLELSHIFDLSDDVSIFDVYTYFNTENRELSLVDFETRSDF